jgi:glycosyltransferase involved in cell wall biosynthesis
MATGNQPATPPRIALLTSSFHPVVGGGETHARLLAGTWRRSGVDVFVVTRRRLPESPAFERVDDIPVHRVPPSGRPRLGKYLMLFPAYRELVRRRAEYDLIYVCGLRVLGLAGVLAALRTGTPCVLRSESRGELAGDFIWRTVDGRLLPARRALFGWLVALRNGLLRRAAGFLAISTDIRAEYEACGVPAGRIALIVNGIDPQRFAPADAALRAARRRELALPAAGRIWAYAGKLNRGKGLEFLVRVWRDYVAAHPGEHLVFIGSGGNQFLSCEAELRAAVQAHALESSVRFTGYVTNVEAWLQAADAFLFPSENEALPLALLEALSCGLPAIASDVGGMRDILRDGENGRRVAVNDAAAWRAAMEALVAAPEQAAAWGRGGRETALARFGIERVAAEHLALFGKLVAAGRKGAPA